MLIVILLDAFKVIYLSECHSHIISHASFTHTLPLTAAIAAAAEAVGTTATDEATIAALNVGGVKDEDVDDHVEEDEEGADATDRRNEERRKRYREAKADLDAQEDDDDEGPDSKSAKRSTHEDQLKARREKDRERYAKMTPEQRQNYNAKRRDQYHRQSEISRVKRRERERARYHSLEPETAKERNNRRARLERERYQKLTPEELEAKNRRRRERAALARQKKEAAAAAAIIEKQDADPVDHAAVEAVAAAVVEAVKAEDDVVSV